MLLIFGGLPGTGKTTIARALTSEIGAIHLRIDSIEQVIRSWANNGASLDDVGYRVAYAIAADNLQMGISVVADSVNPLAVTRDSWRNVGQRDEQELTKSRLRVPILQSIADGWRVVWQISPIWIYQAGKI